MPLTPFQRALAKLLSANRSPDSYLAGGAALHFAANSKRYSNDLDYFHDSEQRVAEAFAEDVRCLNDAAYSVRVEMNQPGFIRATVSKDGDTTKVEWAHDSAWRFMPPIAKKEIGFQLHPVDLAINKVLALVGRDEARDFLDVLVVDATTLSLGALVWAAAGKDPGFTPHSLLELLRRRGRYHEEDFSRLHLAEPVVLPDLKRQWLEMLDNAEAFINSRPSAEIGCLYYSPADEKFVTPKGPLSPTGHKVELHYGRPGGVLPKMHRSPPTK